MYPVVAWLRVSAVWWPPSLLRHALCIVPTVVCSARHSGVCSPHRRSCMRVRFAVVCIVFCHVRLVAVLSYGCCGLVVCWHGTISAQPCWPDLFLGCFLVPVLGSGCCFVWPAGCCQLCSKHRKGQRVWHCRLARSVHLVLGIGCQQRGDLSCIWRMSTIVIDL